jgi:very-short-patch-repair endonuclease
MPNRRLAYRIAQDHRIDEYFRSKDGVRIYGTYVTNRTIFIAMCRRWHFVTASFKQFVHSGSWCVECERSTLEDCQAYAAKQGGECLSTEYIDTRVLMKWICANGHVFWRCWRDVQKSWCGRCYGRSKPLSEFVALVGDSGTCLALVKRGHAGTKCRIACAVCEYVFEATYAELETKRHSCPKCCGHVRVTIEDARRLALEHQGECLSAGLRHSKERIEWRCRERHTWWASYGSVYGGSWCPTCNESQGERAVREYLDFLRPEFTYVAQQHIGKLQKDCSRNVRWLCFDFYVPELRLAIEFDGRQHFAPNERFGGVTALLATMARDERKHAWCVATRTSLLRISHDELLRVAWIVRDAIRDMLTNRTLHFIRDAFHETRVARLAAGR